jgi:hypothetical protein
MFTSLSPRRTAFVSLTALLITAGHAYAVPIAQVSAWIGDSSKVSASGVTPLDTGAVGPDANNFARANANPFAGTVGVGVATDLLGGTVSSLQAHTQASLQENWTAQIPAGGGVDCASINCSPIVQISLHGVLSPDFANPNTPNFGGIFGELDIGNLEIQVQANEPGADLFGSTRINGALQNFFAIPTTELADGSFLIDDTFTVATSIFSNFQSNIFLRADWSGEGFLAAPTDVDLLDTFTFNLVSNDPNIIYTSDSGRTSTFAGPPPTTGVPEPGTIALMALSLISVSFMRRRNMR